MANGNNAVIVKTLTARINAIDTYLKNANVEIPIDGALVAPAALTATYQASLAARTEVANAYAAYKGALAKRKVAETARLATDEGLKGWVLNRFGDGSTEATAFEFEARKKPVVSAETRAHAVAQNKATREARGTKGKKQKLKIKGVVPTDAAPADAAAPTPPANAAPAAAPPAAPAGPVNQGPHQ
jgi:hypothetical protein